MSGLGLNDLIYGFYASRRMQTRCSRKLEDKVNRSLLRVGRFAVLKV